MGRLSPRVQLAIGVAVSAVFLVLAFRGVDFGQVASELATADMTWTLPAQLALLAIVFLLKAWRWALILRPVGRFSTFDVLPEVLIGFMGNNIYPAHLGEFLRAWVFARRREQPFTTAFSSLVVERVFDLLCILIYFFAAIFSLESGLLNETIEGAVTAFATVTGIIILTLIPLILSPDLSLALARKLFAALLPEALAARLSELVEQATRGLAVARDPKLFAACLAISLVHWLLYGLMIICALHAFELDVDLAQALFLQGTTAMAVVVPGSPGFFGLIQFAFRETLSLFPPASLLAAAPDPELSPEALSELVQKKVLAASMYYHLLQYVPITLAGLFALRVLGIKVSDAQAAREASAEEPLDAPADGGEAL